MSVAAGTRLGCYEITAQIGAGGMGDVYRATDTKLGRQVAIKTLPTALAKDPDRLARFEREAKLLAALNHPHIAAIYGLDEYEGTRFLAMELIEGTTLQAKLRDGALPVDDALRLALQIAQALEAAHEKGVVHRDLKPANVMVTRDGQVKVLDFGLAKAFSGDPNQTSPAHSPALSLAMTEQGIILGTAAYMSPEQASGQATDQRADIWAFGVVLFEMLSGGPLFSGESVPHILADVLRSDPDWSRLPKNLHPRLRLLLERCLEKKVRNRYHSMADVAVDIEKVLSDPQGATAAVAIARPAQARAWPLAAALVAGALVAGAVVWTLTRPAPPPSLPVTRFLVTPPDTAPLASLGGLDLAISPDGTQLAYFARNLESDRVALYLRDVDGLDARLVPGTEATLTGNQAVNPFFSADGKSIGFRSPGRGIMRVAGSGGPPLKMLDDQQIFLGADWIADDTLIFSSGFGLLRVSAGGGGTPKLLTGSTEPGGVFYIAPALLPGGRGVLFYLLEGDVERVAVLDLQTGEQKILIEAAANPFYAATGHIVFARGTTLMAVPFDVERLVVTGEPVALLEGVRHPGTQTAADYALSDTGTLVYVPGGAAATAAYGLVWVDRAGRVTDQALTEAVEVPRDPRLSPDGRRLVLTTGVLGDGDLWIYDLGGRPPIPLADERNNARAVWSPDGAQLAFASNRSGIYNVYVAPADGSIPDPMPLRAGAALDAGPDVWSPAGELILWRPGGGSDIVATPVAREGEVRDVVVTADAEFDAALSPNGRWLAYASNRTGQPEIWVKGYPDGVPVRVSREGGYEPRWSANGQELFYLEGGAMIAVAVETDTEFSFAAPVQLFTGSYLALSDPAANSYDVARDGRFLMIQSSGNDPEVAGSTSIVVVQNWFEELKRLVPTK